ncbi:MAG: ROK family protein, partial [Planctomycetaceae bacterium]
TVGIHVDRLLRQGYLREKRAVRSVTGRPPTALELNPKAGQFIGIDLDASQIISTSVDLAQQSQSRHACRLRPGDSAQAVIRKIYQAAALVRAPSKPLLGVGVAVPGTVDVSQGLALHYRYIRGWEQLPLGKMLQDHFGVPVHLENNIRAMAVAERWFGSGREVDDFVCLGIRSGIGSGIFLNGQLYRGPNQFAGEIGSWPYGRSGQSLEDVASLSAILRELANAVASGTRSSIELNRGGVTVASLMTAIQAKDKLATNVVARAAKAIAYALVPITLLLNPSRIIVAGPLAKIGTPLSKLLTDAVQTGLPAFHATTPEIVMSQLGDEVGALGATALAVNQWQPSQ